MEAPYLTYEQYTELGYKAVSEDDFDRFERETRRFLDYATMDRIPESEGFEDRVQECMAQLIDSWHDDDGQVTSYNNGVSSFGFKYSQLKYPELIIERTLPLELYSWIP